jgi:hypothetical protein
MADNISLSVDQGASFEVDFLVKDSSNNVIDISTYTGTGKARKFVSSNTAVTMQINTFSNGILRASLTHVQTNNMTYSDRYTYDIKLTTPSNTIIRVVEGIITINPQVSY